MSVNWDGNPKPDRFYGYGIWVNFFIREFINGHEVLAVVGFMGTDLLLNLVQSGAIVILFCKFIINLISLLHHFLFW